MWVGAQSSREEKESAFKVCCLPCFVVFHIHAQAALDFVAHAPDGRSADTPVLKVTQGNEPPTFTCHFIGWNASKASDFSDPYVKRLAELKAKGGDSVGKVVGSTASPAKTETKSAPTATRVTGAGEGSFRDPVRRLLFVSFIVFVLCSSVSLTERWLVLAG